jgi:sacsin
MPWKGSPELLVAAAPAVRPAEDLWLASASSFVLEGNVYSSSLREQLGWAAAVPVRAIAAQLRACSEAHDVEAADEVWAQTMASVVPRLYEHLAKAMDTPDDFAAMEEELEGAPWVWVGYSFVETKHVSFTGLANGRPYLHTCDLFGFRGLLEALGVRTAFSTEDFVDALQRMANDYGDEQLSATHLELAVSVVQHLADEQLQSDLFVPDIDSVLVKASELVFNDAPWMSETDAGLVPHYVHSKLSNFVAARVGSRSMRAMLLVATSSAMKFDSMEAFGQHESITSRLQNILSLYPEGRTVLYELMQNADDALATEVAFMYDPGTHGSSSLLAPEMAQWQGPALYMYNNSVFTAADYRNLSQLGSHNKLNKLGAVGRFGLGFNAVYHFTDVPSFASGDHIVMLDPHGGRYLPNASPGHPGLKIKISGTKVRKTPSWPTSWANFSPL